MPNPFEDEEENTESTVFETETDPIFDTAPFPAAPPPSMTSVVHGPA
jgi:hypothetical protein